MLRKTIKHISRKPAVSALKRIATNGYDQVFNRRFARLQKETEGMLQPRIYKQIYKSIYSLPDFDVLEIGGASGAGSIAAAWAMRDSAKKSKLIVVEKCEGGSRDNFGSKDDNYEIIVNNFKRFGVADNIVLFPHEINFKNAGKVVSLISSGKIAAIIHDADGRIDREFHFFYPLLIPGGAIIVDDYSDRDVHRPFSPERPSGVSKKIFYYHLLNSFMEWGLFEKSFIIGSTIFGRKPLHADFSRFSLDECQAIIDEIIEHRKSGML